ncbi:MAG: HPr family phosphocarrier protein [Butyricicoccus pullicaecorum]|nr:HPr family phosphocarrier protein [Butyricicoccus pullicaecorum]
MKQITFTVTDPQGVHARPTGVLIKKIKEFQCAATISKDDKTADARKMFAVLGLGIKCGESITLTFDGADEEQAASALAQTLAEHF